MIFQIDKSDFYFISLCHSHQSPPHKPFLSGGVISVWRSPPVVLASSLQEGTMPSKVLDPLNVSPVGDRQTDMWDKWLKFQNTTFITLYVLLVLFFVPSLRLMRTILQCHFWKRAFDLENKWIRPSFKHPQGRTLVYHRLTRHFNF